MGEPIVTANITLNATTPQIAGVTTGIFVGSHRWFPERVRIYTSKAALASDLPTDSNEYIAGSLAFSQKRVPESILIGRREADAVLTPTLIEEGDTLTFIITVNDGDSALVSYTVGSGETALDICTAAKGVIDGDASIAAHVTATIVGTGAAATLEIVATTTSDVFSLTEITGWGFEFTSTETAPDLVAAINAENSSWYGLAASDHTDTFVSAMAATLAGLRKSYFVSTQESSSISTTYSVVSTDILAKVKQLGYLNTITYWHHNADTLFPEIGYFATSGSYNPGEVSWRNYPIIGIEVAKNPTTGLELSETEQSNLLARDASYSSTNNLGTNTVFGGKTASGNWIEDVRFSHFWPNEIERAVGIIMINQQGGKIAGDGGIAKVKSACDSVSSQYLTTPDKARGLDSFKFTFPRSKDILPADKISGVLRGTYYGLLTGEFGQIRIEGTLTYEGLL